MRTAIIVILSLFSLILVGHVVWRYIKSGKMPPTEETLTLVTVLLAIIAILAVVPQNGPTIAAEPTQTLPTPLPTTAPTTVMPTDASTSEPTGTPTETAMPVPPATPTNTSMPSPTSTPTWTATPRPTATATPTPTLGVDMRISEKDGMAQLYVSPGRFRMGSSESSDKPQHEVYLDAFWIDKTEVTNDQYVLFLNDVGSHLGQCDGQDCVAIKSEDSSSHILRQGEAYVVKEGYADHPVINVSWYGANAYCAWAGRTLPTEAQWERAARGADGRIYPWGNESPTCDLANVNDCVGSMSPVGSYAAGASPYGALDMAGNVWEWVADWYDSGYYQNSPHQNPPGPASGVFKVVRGGAWYISGQYARAANRYASAPADRYNTLGFRCAQE